MPSHSRLQSLGAALALVASLWPGGLSGQYYRILPTHRPGVMLEVEKPFAGENYGALTSVVEARVSWPLTGSIAVTGRVGAAYATAGRSSSTTLANPAVGVTVEGPGLTEAEFVVGIPLRVESGDDDYATDVAILSDLGRRDRYTLPRWTTAVTTLVRRPLGGRGVIGGRLGGLLLLPRSGRDTDLDVRYGFFLRVRRASRLDAGVEFHGTARCTGPAESFAERSSHSVTFLLSPVTLPGGPEFLFHLPVDDGVREYVRGMLGVRLTF
jgi:hypothetical protein